MTHQYRLCQQCHHLIPTDYRADAVFCSVLCKNIYNNDRRRITRKCKRILTELDNLASMNEIPAAAEIPTALDTIQHALKSIHKHKSWTCTQCGQTTYINPYGTRCPFCFSSAWQSTDPPAPPRQRTQKLIKTAR